MTDHAETAHRKEAMLERLRTPHGPGLRIGRFVITACSNGHGAPLLDQATTSTYEGTASLTDRLVWRATGRALSLVFRRDRHGERQPGSAVFVGWIQKQPG